MKKLLALTVLVLSLSNLFSQVENTGEEKRAAITLGILQGGGGLIGADFEFLPTEKLGLQIGAGIVSYGAGINYHFKPSIRSSFISLQYWNQGTGESFAQSVAGPSFVFRGKKWFTFQVGIGKTLKTGPKYPSDEVVPVMLLYSIGGYIPI